MYRNGLIYTAIFITLGSAWVAVCVWRVLAWWLITVGSLCIAGVAQVGEWVIVGRLERPKRTHRRAHARTVPTTRKDTTVV